MKIATPEEMAQQEAKKNEPPPSEFIYLPIDQIIVNQQIRQNIFTNDDGFAGLVESIEERGVLEPLLVARNDDGTYALIAGERRLKACQALQMKTVPVRIVDKAGTRADVITLQLIENLDRENLDPIDEASAYLEFLRTKVGAIDAEGIISLIMTYERDPARVKSEFAANFAAISKITGKSTRSMTYMFSLLTLPLSIQAALREGKIGLSQGYLFAAHLNNPALLEIFLSVLKKPVTYEELKKLLEKAAQTAGIKAPKPPFTRFYAHLSAIRTSLETGQSDYTKQDINQLITELEAFCLLLKEQAGKL